MSRLQHTLIAALIMLTGACSDRPIAPEDASRSASVQFATPVTFKFQIGGTWRILSTAGDYVKKIAGDSIEYLVNGSDFGKVAGSAGPLDDTGAAFYVYDDVVPGLHAFGFGWRLVSGYFPVAYEGDYVQLIATGSTYTFELKFNGNPATQRNQLEFATDNSGNVRFAGCDDAPTCPLP